MYVKLVFLKLVCTCLGIRLFTYYLYPVPLSIEGILLSPTWMSRYAFQSVYLSAWRSYFLIRYVNAL